MESLPKADFSYHINGVRTMYIEDEELRNVFKVASGEHIEKLEEDFLFLEKNPQDLAHLEEALREAHTLKGDARMLGISGVETLTHQIEDLLGAAKRKELDLNGKILDRLYLGLDAIRQLVHEAITDEEARISIFEVLAQLMGAEIQQEETSTDDDPFEDAGEAILTTPSANGNGNGFVASADIVSPESHNHQNNINFQTVQTVPIQAVSVQEPASRSPESTTPNTLNNVSNSNSSHLVTNGSNAINPIVTFSETDKYHIDTIRVDPQKLDALMTQVGELTVTKIRISQRLNDIEEIITLWEEWSRDTFVNRLALEKNSGQDGSSMTVSHAHKQASLQNTSPKNTNFHHRLEERLERLGTQLNHLRRNTYEDNARLDSIAGDLKEGISSLRLLPLATVFNLFPRMVRDLARQQAKEVELIIEGGDTCADKHILEEIKDPLMHLIRNAIDHGIELPSEREKAGKPRVATIHLRGLQNASSIMIEISDDGRGLNVEQIRQAAIQRGICREEELASMSEAQIHNLIFTSGFSTRLAVTQISGRGVGLDVVRTNIERLKGDVWVESVTGQSCLFRMQIDTTLATTHVLIAAVKGTPYALPVEFVQTTRLVPRQEIFPIEGSHTITIDEHPISVAWLSDLLELDISDRNSNSKSLPCIILKIGVERLGLIVDALLDEQDVVMKPQSKLLKRIRNVSGATILGTGEVCMILNPSDLLKSARKRSGFISTSKLLESVQRKKIILMVEDSITVRTQVKRILENAGYEVIAAVDGLDGYEKLRTKSVDAVVSDIQMPHLDGLELTARIRQHREYADLPVILVTSLASEEDKRRGAEVGANAYIVKSAFDQNILLETLGRLI
ncbi:MAG: hybrid sensor histidine kinase/response regulator [Pseudanabaenaceae cyanobacterium bins.39]|nr:hybrid sensor histidine kinase/response regulator [Pseudanabaenaceae cyanobacterium bins.39]